LNAVAVTPTPDLADAFDVVVLGGGPAGCATALSLARHGVAKVLVVEACGYDAIRVGESIPPDTRLLLLELGIWEPFLAEAHESCFGSCSSWGDDALGYNDFLFNPLGHGWHLDRRRFDAFLAQMAAEHGVEVCTGTRFIDGEPLGDAGFRLRLAGQEGTAYDVRAGFVVDAMGQRSGFARRVGVRRRYLDRLICVYGFFELTAADGFSKLTMLEAVEYGWWYAARLPDGLLTAAVASDPETVKHDGLHRRDTWLARLRQTRHLAEHFESCRFVEDKPLVWPAPSFLLDRVAGQCWLAVGDAAAAYDPISSQGIYKALSDGLLAAPVIAARLGGRKDELGDYQASVASRFDDYLENRNFFYGLERRWPASSFWCRRQERTVL
jgi:flavin-dependent dehydrogenase